VGLHELPAILGCTEEEFISHIEAQFEPWMNWKNRGLSRGRWVVDHIIPVSAYKRVAVERSCTHEEAKRWLTRYTNLRPLCFTANAKKYNHY
jgi:5-methylcytosine-specific restriction endonuclease McrA